MIPQEELTRTADRLTDALTAAAAVMPPEGARALGSPEGANALGDLKGDNALGDPVPGRRARPASGPVRRGRGRRRGRLRAWLVPVGAAASVTAIILTALTLAGHPETAPASGAGPASASGAGPASASGAGPASASGAGPASAPASGAGPASAPAPEPASASAGSEAGLTSLAGVPSDPGTGTPPPTFYVSIVSNGIIQEGRDLLTVQVRRTSDGQVTGTVPLSALPADWNLDNSISVTADDRTFTVAATTVGGCPSSTPFQTRFYQFSVTSTGHATGLRAVGQLVTGEAVSEFAASPDGTQVAYAEQGCPEGLTAAAYQGVIHVMSLTSGTVRSWRNTVSAATPARVTTQIGALSWTGNGRTLVADYAWKATPSPADLAVLGLDATSSGGSLQAHSHLLFSQGDYCTVCVYTARISADGSTLTAAAGTSVPPQKPHLGNPWHRLYVLQFSVATGQPNAILYRSAASDGSDDDGGLVPVLSADGEVQHWFLVNDPEQFGWISGGKLVPLPIAAGGLIAISW